MSRKKFTKSRSTRRVFCYSEASKFVLDHGINKGRPSPLKGKTYEEIFNSKEKAEKRSKQTSDWMKTDKNIRRYATKISKGQLALYEEILKMFPNAILEYRIPKSTSGNYFLDIAVVDEKINFEYDGLYWHSMPGIPERDAERDRHLNDLGWKVFRCSFDIRNAKETEIEILNLKFKINDQDII